MIPSYRLFLIERATVKGDINIYQSLDHINGQRMIGGLDETGADHQAHYILRILYIEQSKNVIVFVVDDNACDLLRLL